MRRDIDLPNTINVDSSLRIEHLLEHLDPVRGGIGMKPVWKDCDSLRERQPSRVLLSRWFVLTGQTNPKDSDPFCLFTNTSISAPVL